MVVFPPCKINLGLHIISKRPDNYHNIETCFYPVPWTDMLEVIPSDKLAFTFSGAPISGKEESNLCVRAYFLLKQDFDIPAVQLHLHKIIPSGAGLGGGSSDAAATLKLLNEIFSLGIEMERLKALLARQMPDAEKRQRADFVVDSSQGIEHARAQVRQILAAVAKMPVRRS